MHTSESRPLSHLHAHRRIQTHAQAQRETHTHTHTHTDQYESSKRVMHSLDLSLTYPLLASGERYYCYTYIILYILLYRYYCYLSIYIGIIVIYIGIIVICDLLFVVRCARTLSRMCSLTAECGALLLWNVLSSYDMCCRVIGEVVLK